MTDPRPSVISKVLTANDVGATGAHQAGMHIPRSGQVVSFFPPLDGNALNPRQRLDFLDPTGRIWVFTFIYYNNRFYGGTRNEYRLTSMTSYFQENDLHAGATLTLTRDESNRYHIACTQNIASPKVAGGVLRLGTNWRVIRI